MNAFQTLIVDRSVEKAFDVILTLAIEANDNKTKNAIMRLLKHAMNKRVVYRFDPRTCELELKSSNSDDLYVCKNTKHTKTCTCQTNPSKAVCWHKAAWSLLYILLGGKVTQRTQELIEQLNVFGQEIQADRLVLDLI